MNYVPIPFPISSGGKNQDSELVDGSYLENCFIQAVPAGKKNPTVLLRTMGTAFFGDIDGIPLAGIVLDEVLYVVTSTGFYSVNNLGVATLIGAVSFSAQRVTIATNGTHIVFCGREGYWWSEAGGLNQFTAADNYYPCEFVAFLDQYFVFQRADTENFFISGVKSITLDATEIATTESIPDKLLALAVVNREIVMAGEGSTEQWYNGAGFDFPFIRKQGPFIETGIGAPYTLTTFKNNCVWVGEDRVVYRLSGNSAIPISNHDVEASIDNETGPISEAFGFMYADKGHVFYQLTFPHQNITWCYDFITRSWHNRTHSTHGRHHANFYVKAYGKHIIGDFQAGKLYEWSNDAMDDNGQYIHVEGIAPVIHKNREFFSLAEVAIDMKAGTGTINHPDPKLWIDLSTDNKNTWLGNPRCLPIGQIGNHTTRIRSQRFGKMRQAHVKFWSNSPTDFVVAGMYMR